MPFRSANARKPARIQIFVSDLGATGVVRNAVAIANRSAAEGYDVRLLTCRSDGALRGEVSPIVTVINLMGDQPSGLSRRSQLQKAFFAYRRHSRDWRPAILVSAGNHAHLVSVLAWFGLPGRKVLRISNDLDHGGSSRLVRLGRALKFRWFAKHADRLVLVSRALEEHPLLASDVRSGKAVAIPNGTDGRAVRLAAREPCPHPWAKDKVPIVLAIGRHVPQKNFDRLLAAFERARRRTPMRLLILGSGADAATRRLRQLACELSIGPDVDLVPAVANPFPYMSAASVLALPSLWEGSANVLLEAMACGTPVVASRTAGDSGFVLDSGRYGLLVDPLDIDSIASALVRQLGDDRITPGNRAQFFDRTRAMDRYVRLFDELAGNRQAVPVNFASARSLFPPPTRSGPARALQ